MADDKEQTVEERVPALAHQLGRLIGTVERKTEGWLDRDALNRQVTQIRDGAAELLDHLGGAIESGRSGAKDEAKPPKAARASRSGGSVDAPRKKHRPRAESARGVKHSNQTVAKIKGAQTMRRGNRRG